MGTNGRPPLATILKRFAAVLLDGLIPAVIMIPMYAAVGVAVMSGPALPGEAGLTALIFVALLTYVGLVSYLAVVLGMWAYGLTPGKKIMGIQVVRFDTGVPVGFWRMALRQIIGQWVAAIVCYLGFLWALFDANRQGWHDKIAKSVVVQTR